MEEISERKRLVEALLRVKNAFERFLKKRETASPLLTAMGDCGINPAFCEMLGYARENCLAASPPALCTAMINR